MNKKYLFIIAIIFSYLISPKAVSAFSSKDYENRPVCGAYEVAGFHSDGVIDTVQCFHDFYSAKNYMQSNGAQDLAVLVKIDKKTKIVDANMALLDLSVNPETLTNFYNTKELTGGAYTYMDTGSLYGGVDGVHLDTQLSSKGIYSAKVKIGNYTGWITDSAYEIVPITWVKSSSSYTVTNESIRHNYVSKIQEKYNGTAGSTIGPKPDMLTPGTYYSYDGHYFYTNLKTLISDYKNNTYKNAVNKNNKYYNYYMYLSNHTRSNYSSINIDEYIRNNMNIKKDVYGNDTDGNSSRLYGTGTFFYYAQEKYGVNAILSFSLSRNETGNGRSDLAINKNNGFGLDAVDSSPIESAKWYATFPVSIMGYSSKWITNGYAHPRDWRYFGPQFGDKLIGMNVKYASDTYWSEKMAANYYSFDKAKGLQDYNYYQLGVVNGPTWTYANNTTSAKKIYEYPEAEDAVVIVRELKGQRINGSNIWYEIVSDLNIDNNFNEISGDYNWNRTVFVPASSVTKINIAKNGYKSPNSVTEYQDSDYTYDLMVSGIEFAPKVGYSTKSTNFHYDPTLLQSKNQVLKKDRYVIIYSAAYDENGTIKSYLVTSDYWYSQKHWVSADSIMLTNNSYGKVSVDVSGNQYTWVNSITQDTSSTLISGLYTNSYVPVLEEKTVSGQLWYKVPVDISGTTNQYGWTLAQAPGVKIELNKSVVTQNFPVINASNKTIVQGTTFKPLDNVTAQDVEDGNLTNKIKVRSNNVNTNVAGSYSVTYEVTDSTNLTTTKTITVTVKQNEKPVITASNIEIEVNEVLKENYKATDKEDGDITSKVIKTKNTVDNTTIGTYEITYSVTDSYNQTTTKTIQVKVIPEDTTVKEVEGIFFFRYLKSKNGKLLLQGYQTIQGIDNTLDTDISYQIVFENIETSSENTINATRMTSNLPRPVLSTDGKDYTYSWFEAEIDVDTLPVGNYKMYIIARTKKKYSKNVITNKTYNEQATYVKSNVNSATISNNYSTSLSFIEVKVRNKVLIEKTSSYVYNQYDKYTKFEFTNDNKLYLRGNTYSYGMDLSTNAKVERSIIFENKETFDTYTMNLGSVTNGNYNVVLPENDNLDKTRAWYDATLDISNIPEGNYIIYIATKSNISDVAELTEKLGRDLSKVTKMINNKKYSFTINKARGNRIEMIVTK